MKTMNRILWLTIVIFLIGVVIEIARVSYIKGQINGYTEGIERCNKK